MKTIITLTFLLCTSTSFAAGGVWINGDLTLAKETSDPFRVMHFSNGTSQWYATPWSFNNLDLFYNGGNVGIGTNTPAQKLSVAGTIESTIGGFKFPDGTTQTSAAPVGPIGDLTITGNLNLPTTTATTGIITSGAVRLIHAFGTNNIFVGINAGNLTSSGFKNTAIGFNALTSNTTGYQNTAVGSNALSANTTGYQNAANGQYALLWNTSGINNTASGYQTLSTNSTGNYNSATGGYTLYYNETGSYNTADGSYALLMNTTGNNNTALGYQAGYTTTGANANTTGHNNTFIGANSGPGTSTQLTNATAIGYNALVSQNNSLVLGGTGVDAVKVGIGTQTPSKALEVLGTVKATSFQGDGSGLTNVSTATSSTNFTGALAGDVTGTQGATVAGTVGGVSAANVATGANLANAATSANTANSIVKRDASGNFSAAAITAAGVIESQSGGVKFPDGTTQVTAMKAARNVIVVSPSGGHFTTISAALASILDASTTNRYLVYVGPGTYTETVTMKQFVDIQGAGELATKITQVGNLGGIPTVAGASNAELRFLTVENTGGSDFAIAIRNVNASPRLTHITASASGGAETDGIRNIASSPTIRFSTVSATSAGGNYGVYNSDSSPTIESSSVSASGGTSFGIYNATTGGSFTVKVTNSRVIGSFFTIYTIPSYTTLVVASQLSGGAVGGGGTVTCIAAYDENFVAPGYTVCP